MARTPRKHRCRDDDRRGDRDRGDRRRAEGNGRGRSGAYADAGGPIRRRRTRAGRRSRRLRLGSGVLLALAAVAGWVVDRIDPGAGAAEPAVAANVSATQVRAPPGVRFAPGACLRLPPLLRGRSRGTIYLDAGHGGLDSGAFGATSAGVTVAEKKVDLAVVRSVARRLRAGGYAVVVSRWSDTSVAALGPGQVRDGILTAAGVYADVTARVVCANRAGAQVLLSVHADSNPDPQAGGTTTFYEPDRSFAAANRKLARLAQTRLVEALRVAGWPVPDRGVSPDAEVGAPALTAAGARYGHLLLLGPAASGWVENPSRMPGALVELLFLTRPTEADIAASGRGQGVMAAALAAAATRFLSGERVAVGRAAAR